MLQQRATPLSTVLFPAPHVTHTTSVWLWTAHSQWWHPSPASSLGCRAGLRTALPPGGRWATGILPWLWASTPALCTASQTAPGKLVKTEQLWITVMLRRSLQYCGENKKLRVVVWVEIRSVYQAAQPDWHRRNLVFSWSSAGPSSWIWSPLCPRPPAPPLCTRRKQQGDKKNM